MATQMRNDIMLYLMPIANIPEYRIRGACRWLVAHFPSRFVNETHARIYLMNLQQTSPQVYRSIIRRYYQASDYMPETLPKRNCNRYFSNGVNEYGDELHMYY